MNIKMTAGALAIALSPVSALAVPISGQLDLIGNINPQSSFAESDFAVDFEGVGRATVATGSFDPFIIDLDEGAATTFTLNDLSGTGSALIFSGGGFTFTADSFFNFVAAPNTPRGFEAQGVFSGNGFDDTPGVFAFSTQSVGNETAARVSFSSTTDLAPIPVPAAGLLLIGGLGGLAALRKRKK